jgi:hypothetical protein
MDRVTLAGTIAAVTAHDTDGTTCVVDLGPVFAALAAGNSGSVGVGGGAGEACARRAEAGLVPLEVPCPGSSGAAVLVPLTGAGGGALLAMHARKTELRVAVLAQDDEGAGPLEVRSATGRAVGGPCTSWHRHCRHLPSALPSMFSPPFDVQPSLNVQPFH